MHDVLPRKVSSVDANRFAQITAFVAVAEHKSFAVAAEALNLKPSSVSRQVSKLEDALGVRLFARTTRRIALTEAGLQYYHDCCSVLARLSEADATVSSLNAQPRGLLRITAPVAFGRLHLTPVLATLLARNPELTAEINYSDRYVDLVGERYDVAIRIGNLSKSGLIARKIASNRRLVVASPSYIRQHGEPHSPPDLASHNCLRFTHYSSSGGVWQFVRANRPEYVQVSGNLVSDNSETIYQAAVAGTGIAVVAGYLASDAIIKKQLIPLMTDWVTVPEAAIYAIYPNAQHLPPKVRAFIDALVEKFATVNWD
jgi:DNA-binding transcriptional LysR family regulator